VYLIVKSWGASSTIGVMSTVTELTVRTPFVRGLGNRAKVSSAFLSAEFSTS
jgi:hypothetical protein